MSTKRSAGGSGAGKSKRPARRSLKATDLISAPSSKKQVAKVAVKSPRKVKAEGRPAKTARPIAAAKPASPVKVRPSRAKAQGTPVGSPQRTKRPAGRKAAKSDVTCARFAVGDVVRHKIYPFRGVIFDIDPVFANAEEWWLSIPEKMRPRKNQPFYHLLAENAETEYIAYVSEQNLVRDTTGAPVRHPQVSEYFIEDEDGRYRPVFMTMLN